jgi:hypothetical protein
MATEFYSERELLIMVLEQLFIKAIETFEEEQAGAIEKLAIEYDTGDSIKKEIVWEATKLIQASQT